MAKLLSVRLVDKSTACPKLVIRSLDSDGSQRCDVSYPGKHWHLTPADCSDAVVATWWVWARAMLAVVGKVA